VGEVALAPVLVGAADYLGYVVAGYVIVAAGLAGYLLTLFARARRARARARAVAARRSG
jgi:hypothetical protein